MTETGVLAEDPLIDPAEVPTGALQIDRQIADSQIEHQSGHARQPLVGGAELHLLAQRDHQRADGQCVAIDVLQIALATHQAVEGMRVALHRGEDLLDHRLDRLGPDRLAQAGFEKHLRDDLARPVDNTVGMAEFPGLRQRQGRGERNLLGPGCWSRPQRPAQRRFLQCDTRRRRSGGRGRSLDSGRSQIDAALGIDDHRRHVAGQQLVQRILIVQHELAAPEGVLEPAPFQLVDEHSQFEIGNFDTLQHIRACEPLSGSNLAE